MNIGQVGNNGGVDRGADRSARTDGKRGDPSKATGADDKAAISTDGRDAAAAFEAHVASANADEPDRQDEVARAMRRLNGGELDSQEVWRETAARLLASDFRAV